MEATIAIFGRLYAPSRKKFFQKVEIQNWTKKGKRVEAGNQALDKIMKANRKAAK
jgi:hypothetical protein